MVVIFQKKVHDLARKRIVSLRSKHTLMALLCRTTHCDAGPLIRAFTACFRSQCARGTTFLDFELSGHMFFFGVVLTAKSGFQRSEQDVSRTFDVQLRASHVCLGPRECTQAK